jgi:methylenetetrahydrofolate reductase (NADPH)
MLNHMPPRPRRAYGASGKAVPRLHTAHPPRPSRAPLISELLKAGKRSFSFEFMPPKSQLEEQQLWRAIRQLEPLKPTFVSVTYGAGGSTRDRTVRVTGKIAAQTSLTPVGHLTAVSHSLQ